MKVYVQAWKKEFEQQAKAEQARNKKVIQLAAQMLYDNIVKRTPVGNPSIWNPPVWPKGYNPGTLKAAWTIEQQGDYIIISNDTIYAERVETGWSTQAPLGMMRISVLEWEQLLEKAERAVKRK